MLQQYRLTLHDIKLRLFNIKRRNVVLSLAIYANGFVPDCALVLKCLDGILSLGMVSCIARAEYRQTMKRKKV